MLARHSWPGNIRELENALGPACMMAISDMIDVDDLPDSVPSGRTSAATAITPEPEPEHTGVSFDEHEKGLLADALERVKGNQSEAARLLRISRDRLRYKVAKYDLH